MLFPSFYLLLWALVIPKLCLFQLCSTKELGFLCKTSGLKELLALASQGNHGDIGRAILDAGVVALVRYYHINGEFDVAPLKVFYIFSIFFEKIKL